MPSIPGTFDVAIYTAAQLAASNVPSYELAARSNGAKGLDYVNHPEEPESPGRVGTIAFQELSHGLGGEIVSNDEDRIQYAPLGIPAWSHVPDLLLAAGATTQLTGGPTLPALELGLAFSSSFQWNGDTFFITPQKVFKVAAGAGTWTLVAGSDLSAGVNRYTGWPIFHGKAFRVGIENDKGEATGHGGYNVNTATWAFDAGPGPGQTLASFFLPAHGGMYKIARGLSTPGDVNSDRLWTISFTTSANVHLESSYSTIVGNTLGPLATSAAVFGRFILVFNARGEILMVGEAAPIKTLVSQGLLADNDNAFGHGNKPWGPDLVIPSPGSGRLFALNLDSLGIRDIGVGPIQGGVSRYVYAVSQIANYGPDLLVGIQGLTGTVPTGTYDVDPALFLLRNYPQLGPRYNPISNARDSGGGAAALDNKVAAMEFINSQKDVIWITGDAAATTEIWRTRIPDLLGRAPASFQVNSSIRTAAKPGDPPGRKLSLGVRGFAPVGGASSGSYSISVFADGAATAAGSSTAAGPFYFTGARVVGSYFGLSVTLPDVLSNADWPRVNLPIYLDYMELPRSGDRLRLIIATGGGTDRYAVQSLSKEELLAALRALRDGATRTLEFLGAGGAPATFTVLVESVTAAEASPNLYRDYPNATAEVVVKIVS